MSMTRALRAVGVAVATGTLLLATAPTASADQVREDQWPLKAFLAEEIWEISRGKGVTVAVIDDGVDAQHPDLKNNVLADKGKDFIDGGDASPEGTDNHGTAMASIIAGHGHGSGNADGVMGLAPESKILPIRDNGLASKGFGPSIRYAVEQGASVICIAQGGTSSPGELEAISYALERDVLVVAASGNDGKGPEREEYPARYPGVVAVGGVHSSGEIWDGSNYGPHILLTAPASDIVTAGGGTDALPYSQGTGTSNSTAYVSAAAALIKAKYPDLTPGQIVNRLVKTAGLPDSAKDISLPDEKYGYGFIQPLAALKQDIPPGPEMGQLKDPAEAVSQSPSAPPHDSVPEGEDVGAEESGDGDGNSLVPVALGVLGGLVAVGVLVVVLVKLRNRNGGPPTGGSGGPGGVGGVSGYPQAAPPSAPPSQGSWPGQ